MKMNEKKRLDILLVEKMFAPTREKAQAYILSGMVKVDNHISTKAGVKISINSNLELINKKRIYVSRGGLKLEKGLKIFSINLVNKIVADIGASTGGFTDCALKNGAIKVYAIDVGYGQLDWKLRTDDRVINMEKVNARFLTENSLEKVDFVCADVSFISLEKILPIIYLIFKENSEAILLIKPQFEVEKKI